MLAIALPQAMDDVVAQALGQARLMMWLLGIFAGVALLLATVGIYGAVAYTVEQRTGEIGVRMALGAQTMDVLRLVVLQGMKPVIFGLIIGLTAALAVGRLIKSQLYRNLGLQSDAVERNTGDTCVGRIARLSFPRAPRHTGESCRSVALGIEVVRGPLRTLEPALTLKARHPSLLGKIMLRIQEN